jgi:hypothetical protein
MSRNHPVLSESQVGPFMAQCLPTYPASTCVCLLESFATSAKAEPSAFQGTAKQVRELFRHHSAQCQRPDLVTGDAARTSEPLTAGEPPATRELASAVASGQPTVPTSLSARAQIVGSAERAATDVETCVQTEVVKRSLEEPEGTLAMTEFDAIRKKCGGG